MTKETAQPVVGPDGKVIPGLFAFDVLERDPQLEIEIAKFISEEKLNEEIKKIEASK